MTRVLLFLVILCCFTDIFAKHDCATNASVPIKMNEIIFFETPSFPLLMDRKEIMANNFTFSLEENYSNEPRITLVLTILVKGNGYKQWITYINFINASSFSLQNYILAAHLYYPNAIQGYAFFETWKEDSCPFESISRKKSFEFSDDTESMYIQSAYINQSLLHFENLNYDSVPSLKMSSCRWRFKAPQGHGFKVVVTRANLTVNTDFVIQNTTAMIANTTSVKENYPYYNNDNYVEIILTSALPNLFMDLQIAVSVEKLNVTKTEGKCLTKIENNRTIWYSVGYDSTGYDNKTQCSHTEIVNSDFDILVWVKIYSVEIYADYISYCYENESICYKLSTDDYPLLVLRRNENGSEKIVHFEFESDGSVEALGFRLEFEKLYCTCSEQIIRCDNSTHTVMKDTVYVCQNIKCKFTIVSCKTELTYLDIQPMGDVFDVFKIVSNGVIVFDINKVQPFYGYHVFLNSSYKHYLEVQTLTSATLQKSLIGIYEYNTPSPNANVILSLESPSYFMDISIVTFATFELSESLIGKNTSVAIYGNVIPFLIHNKSLTSNIAETKCFNDRLYYKCNIENRENFAIYTPQNYVPLVDYFFVTLTKQRGCVFEENVFYLDYKTSISSTATDEDPCHVTFFNGNLVHYFTSLWTNSKTENVQIFIGIGLTQLFFEYNSRTAQKWQKIWLTSSIYTIKIPKNASIFVKISDYSTGVHDLILQSYHSLISIPPSGIVDVNCQRPGITYFTYDICNVYVKFTALDYRLASGNDFYFQDGIKQLRINRTGDFMIFKNQSVDLHYICGGFDGNSVLLLVETMNEKELENNII